jgi:hypothetical protein
MSNEKRPEVSFKSSKDETYTELMKAILNHQRNGIMATAPTYFLLQTPWNNLGEMLLARSGLVTDPLPLTRLIDLAAEDQCLLQSQYVRTVKAIVRHWRQRGDL